MSDYNIAVGLDNVLTPIWTFWNAMFLAVTTYTTIGYGNITAKTKLGKLAAMVYAVIGIPLVLMILHKLGRFFLLALEHIWDFVMRGAEYLCFVSGSSSRLKLTEEERISEMPLLLALGVAFGWMFLCAAIFLRFEKDWDYFKSFYFFFCSLTTIGYGMIEMWRVWKKRKSRLRNGLAPARQAAGKASQNLAKVIPFAKRRNRQHLIEELHHRLRQKHKATQTDFIFGPILEEAWTETSDVDSYTTSCSVPYDSELIDGGGAGGGGGGNFLLGTSPLVAAPSRCESRPVVVQAEHSAVTTPSVASSSQQTSSGASQPQSQSTGSQFSKM
ncbi:Ion channel [Teladorsagia circumcincta]|uniref:Ion channel n=1 Tax=Teladorsagia circumcincta TaxID=45464 RepID=A0A2G9UFQ0_TELCI|nr:Ion channel [Teladorsagia circumcincta]